MLSNVARLRDLVTAAVVVFSFLGEAAFAEDEMVEALKVARSLIEFQLGDDPLTAHAVLTTTNPSRGAGSDGTMMLWLDEGRPLVAVSVYNWEGKVLHEIDSLARVAGVTGTGPKGRRWKSSLPGIAFKPLAEFSLAKETAETRRLLKMKEFAKQFQVTMLGFNDQNSDREQLRMLTTPIYRYSLNDKRTRYTDVIDGAVFAFVQGSDPEALLIIEGIENEQKIDWQYAFVRSTAGALEARRKAMIVFSAEKFPVSTDPTQPHFTFESTVEEVLEQ